MILFSITAIQHDNYELPLPITGLILFVDNSYHVDGFEGFNNPSRVEPMHRGFLWWGKKKKITLK